MQTQRQLAANPQTKPTVDWATCRPLLSTPAVDIEKADTWIDGLLGFYGILCMQTVAKSYLKYFTVY